MGRRHVLFVAVLFIIVLVGGQGEGNLSSPNQGRNTDQTKIDQPTDYAMGLVIPEEVKEYWRTHKPSLRYSVQSLLSSIDWSSEDSPVKSQGSCGSCWAFAAVAIVENIGVQNDLAEQVIVSCVQANGCGGGWYGYALEYVHDDGLPPESCYPYLAANGDCNDKCSNPDFLEYVTQYDKYGRWGVPDAGTVGDLKALLQNGPVCVSMRVPEGSSFTGYSGGIYNYSGGPIPEYRGHAILLVGYDDNQQYFKAKNSWGSWWGEDGYFRIAYDDVTDDVMFGGYACVASGAYTVGGGDTNPPTMEEIVEAEGHDYSTAPSFSNFGFDDDEGLDDGWYQLNSCVGAWIPLFTDASGTSWDDDGWTIPGFAGLPEGSNTIYFKADDDADNVGGGCTWSWQFFKLNPDTEPPTMEEIVEAEGQYYETAPTFSNFGFDDNEDLDEGGYQIDSYAGSWTLLFDGVSGPSWDHNGWSIPEPEFEELSEGSHTIYFAVRDDAENSSGLSGELSWQFYKVPGDHQPPTMEEIVEAQGQYYQSAPTFSNFGFDDDVDLDDGWYQVDSHTGVWTSLFTDVAGTSWDDDGWAIPGFEGFEDGSHTIYFKADDDSGNTAGHEGEWSWQFYKGVADEEPPTMEEIVEAEGQHYETAPTFSNFGFDDNEDLDEGGYQIDSHAEAWTVLFDGVSGSSWDDDGWSIPCFEELNDGSHTIYFMAKDDAGNSMGQEGEWSWHFYKETPDDEPPTMEHIAENEGQYYKTPPTFSNFGFDDNVDLNEGGYQIDSYTGDWTVLFDDVSGPSWDDDGWSIPESEFEELSEGSHTIYFIACDDVGHSGGQNGEWSWQFYKDTVNPTITYHYPDEGDITNWYSSDPGAVIDIDFGWVAHAPLDYASYKIGGGQWHTIFTVDRSADYTHNWGVSWSSLGEGENVVSMKVADKAGNMTVHSYELYTRGFVFLKDTIHPAAPVISSETHPSESTWYSENNPSLSWEVTPDASGIEGFSYVLDQNAHTTPDEDSEGYYTLTEYMDVPEGIWYFHCRAVDGAGLWGSAAHYTIRIDGTAPGPPEAIEVDPEGWSHTDSFTLWWSGPEDVSGIDGAYFKLDEEPHFDTDGEYVAEQPIVIHVHEDGEHTLYLWLQDGAGNTSKDHASSISLRYDGSGPVGTISIDHGALETESLVVTLTDLRAEDELSGVDHMQFSNDGEIWSEHEPYDTSKAEWDLSIYGGTDDPGVKTVYVRYRDGAGNWSEPFSDEIFYVVPLHVITGELEPAILNVSYSASLEAAGGRGQYAWSIVSGLLPEGLSLSVFGDISGAPTSVDTFTAFFTVQVTDTAEATARQDLSITVCERMRGDVNADGNIDIIDGIAAINLILWDSCATMEGDNCWAADMTGNDIVDIIDVLQIIIYILDQSGSTAKPSLSTSTVATMKGCLCEDHQSKSLAVEVDSPEPIAAVQLTLRCEGVSIPCGSPELTTRSQAMTVSSKWRDNEFTILLYSFEGNTISAGSDPILFVPLTNENTVRIEQIILADVRGDHIEVIRGPILSKGDFGIPTGFVLYQNHPNPFNPETEITFHLPEEIAVTVTIYNVLGQVMEVLVDEQLTAGLHVVRWNGERAPSGVYFYRLTAGEFTATKRMVLMR